MDLSILNPAQREAVLHPGGPLVVYAGAGSGKTRVIVHRIAHLLAERQVPPQCILAVTFTNKAAAEMRERLERLVPGSSLALQVGTFHAICARLLRRYHQQAGIPRDFVIYDEDDQKATIKRILRDLGYDEKRFPPRGIAWQIDQAKNEVRPLAEVEAGPDTPYLRAILVEYEKRMQACKALDFGDLIVRMVQALESDEVLREQLAERFRHVLVDEFQDTNRAQLRLVLALASIHRNVCVVGDDDQSIYRWRGADRRNLLDFRAHYPDAHVVKLEQNYRSTKRILRAAQAVIERALDREPKRLWTENDDGAAIEIVTCPTERDEADLVVEVARELRRSGRRLSDLAVFYRIHAQSRVIEEALRAAAIPYRVVGGVRFYDRAEIKDLLAYLRVLQSPEDDVSLLRILNVPPRGIGKTTVDRLLDRAARTGRGVWEACKEVARERGGGRIADFVTVIETLRAQVDQLPLPDLARTVLEATGYAEALRSENTVESDARVANLDELIGSMEQFVADREDLLRADDVPDGELDAELDGAKPPLAAFLERVTLATEPEGQGTEGDAVTLMTVHAAKGLEFPVVIVAGMEERLFPMRGTRAGEDPEELEEERRLAYVAFTRARERLILSWATTRYLFGNLSTNRRSRFLDEIPASDCRFLDFTTFSQPTSDAAWIEDRRAPPWVSRDATSLAGWIEDRGGSRLERFEAGPRRALTCSPIPSARGEPRLARTDGEGALRVGQRVRHLRYGEGRVVRFGTGSNVEVDFVGYGRKTIRSDFLDPV